MICTFAIHLFHGLGLLWTKGIKFKGLAKKKKKRQNVLLPRLLEESWLFLSAFSCLYNFPVCTTHDCLLLEEENNHFLSLVWGRATFTLLVWKPCVFSLVFICVFEKTSPPFVEIQTGAQNRPSCFLFQIPYNNSTANQENCLLLRFWLYLLEISTL